MLHISWLIDLLLVLDKWTEAEFLHHGRAGLRKNRIGFTHALGVAVADGHGGCGMRLVAVAIDGIVLDVSECEHPVNALLHLGIDEPDHRRLIRLLRERGRGLGEGRDAKSHCLQDRETQGAYHSILVLHPSMPSSVAARPG